MHQRKIINFKCETELSFFYTFVKKNRILFFVTLQSPIIVIILKKFIAQQCAPI